MEPATNINSAIHDVVPQDLKKKGGKPKKKKVLTIIKRKVLPPSSPKHTFYVTRPLEKGEEKVVKPSYIVTDPVYAANTPKLKKIVDLATKAADLAKSNNSDSLDKSVSPVALIDNEEPENKDMFTFDETNNTDTEENAEEVIPTADFETTVRRDQDGDILPFAVLGSLEDMEEVEEMLNCGQTSMDGFTDEVGGPGNSARLPGSARPPSPNGGGSHHSGISRRSGGSKYSQSLGGLRGKKEEVPDPFLDPKKYYEKLNLLKTNAERYVEQEAGYYSLRMTQMTKSLASTSALLSESEKAKIKDLVVTGKWASTTQDWDSIKHKLSKVTNRPAEELCMETGQAFREKAEEMDLIQLAIPLKYKQGDNYWQMSLRDNYERFEPIGGSMSGLYCPVKPSSRLPANVRASSNMDYFGVPEGTTLLSPTQKRTKKKALYHNPNKVDHLEEAKQKWKAEISALIPHKPAEDDILDLGVKQKKIYLIGQSIAVKNILTLLD